MVFRGSQANLGLALDSIKFKNHGFGYNIDLTFLILDLNDRCVDKASAKVNR